LSIWDDHDIIDGYGSYTDSFMSCPVFAGIGRVARKYYMLFQQHTPPAGETPEDTNWIIGSVPGKYIGDHSRSLYARLGKRVAFLGVDGRSERTRRVVNEQTTYDRLFERASRELEGANGDVKHLIVLLSVPIAFPRLRWLEFIIQSPLTGLISFLSRKFGRGTSLFNQFDGNADIL
jgi:hypothetical protein